MRGPRDLFLRGREGKEDRVVKFLVAVVSSGSSEWRWGVELDGAHPPAAARQRCVGRRAWQEGLAG